MKEFDCIEINWNSDGGITKMKEGNWTELSAPYAIKKATLKREPTLEDCLVNKYLYKAITILEKSKQYRSLLQHPCVTATMTAPTGESVELIKLKTGYASEY